MDVRHAVVVGAGIGGLGAAIGLCRAGWRVTVLEQARGFEPVGAGITLMPNALRALDELGVGHKFRALAPMGSAGGGLRTSSGQWLSRWDGAAVQRVLGAPTVALHRSELARMLSDRLPAGSVRLGVRVTGVDPDVCRGQLRVFTDAGAVDDADLVVAADGIHSRLRAQLWPDAPAPAYSGVTTWRGLAPAPPGAPLETSQSWGRGAEFGVIPLADGRIYWFGAVEAPPGGFADDERAAARAQFGAWHDPIPQLLDTSDMVLHHDIEHLPALPRSLAHGRVALLGDAAHAMTPHLGQGGCQALEDAVVLAAALTDTPDTATALTQYDRARRARVQAVRRAAAQARRINAVRNPVAIATRNTLIKLTPPALGVRSIARISRWQPPGLLPPRRTDDSSG